MNTVANTIVSQIRGALAMLGAKDLLSLQEGGLQFSVQGSRKCNKIQIVLDPSDTYTVTAFKYNRKTFECLETGSYEGVYVNNLHHVLSELTGLSTRI